MSVAALAGPAGEVVEGSGLSVLVVIVNYKTAGLTVACLRSLADEVAGDASIGVVVVDNDSGDSAELRRAVREHGWSGWARVVDAGRNGGFAFGNNVAVAEAMGWKRPPAYFLLLNPDTEVRRGAVRALREFLDARPEVGIAGSSFENPDGSEWPFAFRFMSVLSEFERGVRLSLVTRALRGRRVARTMGNNCERVDWVAGASMMVRREVFRDVGLMDAGYFLYYEEVDFCRRAGRGGWPCWYVPQSRVMHISGQATGVSNAGPKTRPMPAYWFESRQRYFVNNEGVLRARLADLAFGVGLALYKLREWAFRLPNPDPPGFLRDVWRRSSLWVGGRALRARHRPDAGVTGATPGVRA